MYFSYFKSMWFSIWRILAKNNRAVKHIVVSIAAIEASVQDINEKVGALDIAMEQQESRVSEMEKDIHKHSQI